MLTHAYAEEYLLASLAQLTYADVCRMLTHAYAEEYLLASRAQLTLPYADACVYGGVSAGIACTADVC
jgi:hypothetical protein